MAAWEELTAFQILGGNMTVTQAVEIGIGGGIFGADEDAKYAAFVLDAIAYKDRPVLDVDSYPGYLLMTHMGCGLRVAFKYSKIAGGINLGFAQLGMAARAGLSSVSYQVVAPGLGPSAMDSILMNLPSQGMLDDSTYGEMIRGLISSLTSYLKESKQEVTLVPIRSLSRINPTDEIQIAKAVLYGMSAIINRRASYEQAVISLAMGGSREDYDAKMIRYAYNLVLPGRGDAEAPTASDVERAKAWMRLEL